MKKPRPSKIAWTICIIGLLLLFAAWLMQPQPSQFQETAIAASGSIGGDFTLTNQDGKKVTNKSWPGKYQLLYFGFTHCPDVCPLGLNKMAEALNMLPKSLADKVQPVFITVDPARDTPAEIKKYVILFYPTLVGLTGSEADIEHVKKLFKVYSAKQGDGKDYMVNHSAFTYLIDPQGQLVGLYSNDSTANEMADNLRKLLDK